MVKVEKTVVVDRPLEEVFEYMTRFENDADWRSEIVAIRRTDEIGPGTGARYEQLIDFGGKQLPTDFLVTEYEAGRRIAFEGTSGDVKARGAYDFEAQGGRTSVHVAAEVEVSGALRGTEDYIRDVLERVGSADLERLKDSLEAMAPAT